MPRASRILASVLSLCLVAPSFAQESQQSNNESKQNQKTKQSKKDSQKTKQGKQNQQMVDVSLDEGQTIAIPTGGELLELTVAVPKTVRSGQRYRYRARIRNTSDNITLANVDLVQIDGQKIDIEDARMKNQKGNQKGNQKNAQKGSSKNKQDNQQSGNSSQQAQQSSQGNNRNWSLGQLKPGQSRELAVTAIASQTGQLEHCFAVKYDEVLCTQVDVVHPDVTITKSAPKQAVVCEVFDYKYTVKNTGTGVAKNFIVRDKLPQGLKTESGKDSLEFRVPDLKEGESETYVAKVHTMKAGDYSSRATVEQQSGQTSRSGNVKTQLLAPELNLRIEGPRAFKANEGGNFDVVVKNTSDVKARDVVLNVTPGKNARVTRAGDGDAREGGNSYRYNIGDMKAGSEKSVSISIDGNKEGSSKEETLQIKATAKALCARDQDQEHAIAQAESSMQSKVLRLTSLLMTVVDMDDVIQQGKNVSYRIRVRNQGSFPDKDVKVKLQLPSGLKFEEASGPSEATANGSRVDLGTVDKIAPGKTLEWRVTTKTESSGEQIVTGTLDSNALSNTVEAEEITTVYDGSQQQSSNTNKQKSGNTKTDSKTKNGSQNK